MMEDVQQLESLLEEKSAEVSNYLNESVAKREQTQEHLQVKIEAIKSIMTHNSSCIQKLRSKIAKEACIAVSGLYYFTPTDTPVSFSSILKDFERTVKEAKEEAQEANKLLNEVAATITEFSVKFYYFLRHCVINFQ